MKRFIHLLPVPLLLLLTAASVTALVPTTLNDFFLPGSQPGQSGQLETPDKCDNCHGGYDQAVEPAFTWRGSMMSQAARDPFFYACMSMANQSAEFSGDLCIRCHSPAGWLEGRSVPTDGSALNVNDRQGVQCDFCHKLVNPLVSAINNPYPTPTYPSDYTTATYPRDLTYLATLTSIPPAFANGMYVVDVSNAKRGPFNDAVARHQSYYSPFHSESGICGTCHDVSNPVFTRENLMSTDYTVNALNTPSPSFNPRYQFPVERTFSEWTVSAYNTDPAMKTTCQDCHMRDVTGKGANKRDAPTRTNLPLHDMTGGNTWVPDLINQFFPGESDAAALAAGKLRAKAMLQSAAELSCTGTLSNITVKVKNLTGHKLPSGYPEGRRIWINVRAFEGTTLIAEYGGYDPVEARIYDMVVSTMKYYDPGLDNGTPVYYTDKTSNILAKSKIYEVKLGMSSNPNSLHEEADGSSFFFVLNNKVIKDNRIPPAGFTNAKFTEIQSPHVAYQYDDYRDYDETTFDLPSSTTRYEVRLMYQITSREYVEFLRDENHTDQWGQRLLDAWTASGKAAPVEMEYWQSAAAPDNIAPSTPTNLVATAPKSNTVNLTWTPSTDNVAVAGYRVYRNGTLLATVPLAAYTDLTVAANTSYSYHVIAFDGAGNSSAQSNTATVTTPAKGKKKEAWWPDAATRQCLLAPNPTTTGASTLHISVVEEARAQYTLHDASGRLVHTGDLGILPVGVHSTELRLAALPPGTWFVRVTLLPTASGGTPTQYVLKGLTLR
jgi:hypothetical protein